MMMVDRLQMISLPVSGVRFVPGTTDGRVACRSTGRSSHMKYHVIFLGMTGTINLTKRGNSSGSSLIS
jgi:hypothetical protein